MGSRVRRLQWLWLLGLVGSAACGVFPGERLNPCALHCQVDSYPLDHQGEAFDCVDENKLWKILKEMGIPDHLTCLLRNL